MDIPEQRDHGAEQDTKLLWSKGEVDGVGNGKDSVLHQHDLSQMMRTLVNCESHRGTLM
jgi:hypothetical protein